MARRHGPPEECPAGRHTPQGSAATTTRRNRPFPRRTCGETKPTGWPVPPTGHKSSAGPRKPPPFFPRSLVPDLAALEDEIEERRGLARDHPGEIARAHLEVGERQRARAALEPERLVDDREHPSLG